MATLAAPGKYAAPPGIVSTTIDAMGHQMDDTSNFVDQQGVDPMTGATIWTRIPLRFTTPLGQQFIVGGPITLAGNFGSKRERRFANAPSM